LVDVQRSRNPNQPPGISLGATFGAAAFVLVIAVLIWHGRGYSRKHGTDWGSKHVSQTVDLKDAKSAS